MKLYNDSKQKELSALVNNYKNIDWFYFHCERHVSLGEYLNGDGVWTGNRVVGGVDKEGYVFIYDGTVDDSVYIEDHRPGCGDDGLFDVAIPGTERTWIIRSKIREGGTMFGLGNRRVRMYVETMPFHVKSDKDTLIKIYSYAMEQLFENIANGDKIWSKEDGRCKTLNNKDFDIKKKDRNINGIIKHPCNLSNIKESKTHPILIDKIEFLDIDMCSYNMEENILKWFGFDTANGFFSGDGNIQVCQIDINLDRDN